MQWQQLLQKLPKNAGDLGKMIVATGFEKLPNLVTLVPVQVCRVVYKARTSIRDVITLHMKAEQQTLNKPHKRDCTAISGSAGQFARTIFALRLCQEMWFKTAFWIASCPLLSLVGISKEVFTGNLIIAFLNCIAKWNRRSKKSCVNRTMSRVHLLLPPSLILSLFRRFFLCFA